MISKQGVQALALAAALASTAVPAGAQVSATGDQAAPDAAALFSKTMSFARDSALRARADAYAVMSREERAAATAKHFDLAPPTMLAESATGQGVEAAFTTKPSRSGDDQGVTARRRLEAMGIANDRTARRAKTEAKYRDPLRYDEDGYYFSYAQTRRYYSNRYTDRIGLYSSSYYELLRCRSARPIGLLGGNPAWRDWSWRVCPDAQGRYRPTL
jgi:hypothetical protein